MGVVEEHLAAPERGYFAFWSQGDRFDLWLAGVGDIHNAEAVGEPVELEQTVMEMKTIQKLVDRINPRAVVPVALGIKQVQQGGTDLKFRYVNDMHPNQYSAFLASNMFYAAFYGKSTEGFNYNTVVETKLKDGKDPDGGDKTVVLDESTKKLLQKAAYDAVVEFNAAD